jgi:hypothetical protein
MNTQIVMRGRITEYRRLFSGEGKNKVEVTKERYRNEIFFESRQKEKDSIEVDESMAYCEEGMFEIAD